MTAAIELKHQLLLVLKSEHKLVYFNVQLWGEKKIFSEKKSSHTDIVNRIWSCEIVVLYFSIQLSILALRNLCDSNKQAVGTNMEMQDLWDEQRKFTQKQNRLSTKNSWGVTQQREKTQVMWKSQKWKTVGQLMFTVLPDIVSHYGCRQILTWLIKPVSRCLGLGCMEK